MKAVIYTQNNCQFTPQEKTYLTSKGVSFEERNVEANKEFLDEMMKLGANFAGTPVTQITKDDGTTAVLKGFTQTEFDAALGGAVVAAANADMTVPPMPVTPPAPVEPVMPPEPMPTPMPEPTPAPVVETPAPVVPEPVPSAPVEPVTQAANADMTMPVTPPAPVEPVMPPVPEPMPTPMPEPTPAPVVETPAPVVPEPVPSAPVEPVTQTASNPLDAILADLQQKVSAAAPTIQSHSDSSVQAANADMTMPSAPQSPVDQPVTPPAAPEPVSPTVPEPVVPQTPPVVVPGMPTPPAPTTPSADLPSVPDFK